MSTTNQPTTTTQQIYSISYYRKGETLGASPLGSKSYTKSKRLTALSYYSGKVVSGQHLL